MLQLVIWERKNCVTGEISDTQVQVPIYGKSKWNIPLCSGYSSFLFRLTSFLWWKNRLLLGGNALFAIESTPDRRLSNLRSFISNKHTPYQDRVVPIALGTWLIEVNSQVLCWGLWYYVVPSGIDLMNEQKGSVIIENILDLIEWCDFINYYDRVMLLY